MRFFKYCIIASILFISFEKANSQKNELRYSVNGFLEFDHFSFFKEKTNLINHRNQSMALLSLKSNFSDSYALFSSVEFRNDLSDSKRNRVYLKEAYIDVFSKKIDLRIGKQVILWGKADGFNPTSNLTPVDYSDILDTEDEEIGIFSANAKFYIENWQIQGVFSPVFQASIFPPSDSRWQQDIPAFINYNGADLPAHFYWKNTDITGNNIRDNQFAVKISKEFNNMDFSISYYRGLNDVSNIYNEFESVINDTANIAIIQDYYRHQVLGIDFSYMLGKYIIKGEGAFFIPEKTNENKPYFQYVVGFDRTFSNVIQDKNMFVIIQWIQEIKSPKASYGSRDLNHLFQQNIMSRIELDCNKHMQFLLQCVYSTKYEDFYLKPALKYNIYDGINLHLSTDILGGNKNKGGFFSSYSGNNRIQVKLKCNF